MRRRARKDRSKNTKIAEQPSSGQRTNSTDRVSESFTQNGDRERPDSPSSEKLRLIVECVVAVTAIVGTIFLVLQWRQTERALSTANMANALAARQFDLSQRPWLSAELRVIDPLKFDASNGNGSIGLEILLKNSGQSVALNARVIHYMIGDLLLGPKHVKQVQDSLCERFRREDIQLGNVVFPGEVERMTEMVRIKREHIEAASQRLVATATTPELEKAWRGRIIPGLITCIDYRTSLKPTEHYQTRYFSLIGARPDDFTVTGAILPVGTIDAKLADFLRAVCD
jgi:hypothetical protein